nr:MAG TPA: hypothetical protein [Caudoviricetes sp.]
MTSDGSNYRRTDNGCVCGSVSACYCGKQP